MTRLQIQQLKRKARRSTKRFQILTKRPAFVTNPYIINKSRNSDANVITATDLANMLCMNPKSLRRKIRSIKEQLPKTITDKKWAFPISAKSQLIELLS